MLDVDDLTALDTHGQRKQRLVELAVATHLALGCMVLGIVLSRRPHFHTLYLAQSPSAQRVSADGYYPHARVRRYPHPRCDSSAPTSDTCTSPLHARGGGTQRVYTRLCDQHSGVDYR